LTGWIKLHRDLISKAIWQESTPEQKTILITLLMMANHQEKEWEWKGEKYKALPGQFVTSLPSIVKKCGKGITIQNVRTALARFEKYEFLTDESTNKNRLITIVNWELYQSKDDELTDSLTGNQQATNRQLTANKNDKNNKNINNNIPLKKESKIFNNEDKEYLLAEYLSKQIAKRLDKPLKEEKDLQRWAADFNKMVRLDKYDIDEIKEVLIFSQKSDFWQTNILSAAKFRKQYLTLLGQMKRENNKSPVEQPKANNKFHNFDQRMSGMNLEELANKRREEMIKKIGVEDESDDI